MDRWRRQIGTAIAVVALVATPGMLSACVALCMPDAAGHVATHDRHGAHAASPAATGATGDEGGHAGHRATARADAPAAGDGVRLSGAAHDCCASSSGVVLLAGVSGRSEAAAIAALAPPVQRSGLMPLASNHARGAVQRPIPPPSPPPAPLVLRI